jgi:DNA-binding NarL/FixJ family response regulator
LENTTTKILIADDHALIATGLKSLLLKSIQDAKVTTVSSKEELFNEFHLDLPDVILLDLFMGKEKAHDFFDKLINKTVGTKIIILSSNEDPATIAHFMHRGAHGFIGKSEDTSLIPLAIEKVMEGETFLSKYLQSKLESKDNRDNQISHLRLTRREKEVLAELLKEKSNKEIGESLFISEKTVEHHKANLYVKFDVKNASGLVKKAIINGFYE